MPAGRNYPYVSFRNANLTDATFIGANLTNADLTEAICDGANFSDAIMPDNANTKVEFRGLVGSWDMTTTIWTDGNPIGDGE